jgi:hypothetical protein
MDERAADRPDALAQARDVLACVFCGGLDWAPIDAQLERAHGEAPVTIALFACRQCGQVARVRLGAPAAPVDCMA